MKAMMHELVRLFQPWGGVTLSPLILRQLMGLLYSPEWKTNKYWALVER